jgi:hypothetical protein
MLRDYRFIAALTLGNALLAGCVAYAPYPGYYVSSSPYERTWSGAIGAVRDAGVQVMSEDYTAGIIRGAKDGIDVFVTVARQADGSVRVQFDTKGPTERDPGLANRFSQAYDRRMGR